MKCARIGRESFGDINKRIIRSVVVLAGRSVVVLAGQVSKQHVDIVEVAEMNVCEIIPEISKKLRNKFKRTVGMMPANTKRNIKPTNSDVNSAKPKRVRAGLTDLSNAVSSTLRISSSAKDKQPVEPVKKPILRVRSEEYESKGGEESDSDDSDAELCTDLENSWRDPCPEFDYDATNRKDPFQIPIYATDIFRYLFRRELDFRPIDYLPRHPNLKKVRRAKIIDWFVRCQEDFEVNHEVLYQSVKTFDFYLGITENKDEFEYIGAAAMIIAAKTDQQDAPIADDFSDLSEVRKKQIINDLERKLLMAFDGNIMFPISYGFLRRFSKTAGLDMPTLTLARYILETSLLFYEFICVPDSLMAAAALLMAMRMVGAGDWSLRLEKYSRYKLIDLEPLMWRLNHMMKMRPKVYPACGSIETKYSHEVFFHAAGVPLLPDKRPRNEPVGPPEGLDFAAQF